jgi:hypothetical protein
MLRRTYKAARTAGLFSWELGGKWRERKGMLAPPPACVIASESDKEQIKNYEILLFCASHLTRPVLCAEEMSHLRMRI